MKFILNWALNGLIIYLASHTFHLMYVEDLKTGLIVSLVAAVITLLIRILSGVLKVTGCLTLGITYILGLIIGLFAIPIALHYTQYVVDGFKLKDILSTIIVSFFISVTNSSVIKSKKD
ncbi:phage holin family protein [Guggenheimella bovis]